MKVTISGPPGSGTTSLAQYLARRHGFELISAGEVFRNLAKERSLTLAEFSAMAENDLSIDALIDVRQKEIASQKDDIIVEGRLSGWMVENADIRIWLTAPMSCRAKRIAQRDGGDEYSARDVTIAREESERIRYLNYYKIDINDLSPYHLVIDSELWDKEQLGSIVDLAITCLRK